MASLTAILSDLSAAHRKADALRLKLVQEMPFTGSSAPVDILMAHAEEFGVDHTLGSLGSHPEFARLTADHVAKLKGPLTELYDLTHIIDRLTAAREDILIAADPSRVRRYAFWGGVEFTLDPKTRTMAFYDRTTPLDIDPALFGNRPTKRRVKQRDR